MEVLQGKTCQDSLLSGEGRSPGAKISGGRGSPWGILFGLYKTRHILLSDSVNCTVLRAVVLTQYRRVTDKRMDRQTDGRTDGNAIASTAFAVSALRRAVKTNIGCNITTICTGIFLYADDIILLAPSIRALQSVINLCELELDFLCMTVNAKKSACLRVEPRYKIHVQV